MKILAAADIHLGRRSTMLPESAADYASMSRVWLDITEYAVKNRVDCVLLAGDIIDENNRFYEAIGPFEKGINMLTDRGIHIFAVAGNHDCEILPAAVSSLNSGYFHLLGEGGKWEHRTVLAGDNNQKLQVFGWSFPQRHVEKNPLGEFPRNDVDKTALTLGILHADRDTGSRYCPALTSEFFGLGVPLWILGHVHKPSDVNLDASTKILYPGSPQGMDPGETGHHGVLLFETAGNELFHKAAPVSPVFYENFIFDITGIKKDINSRLFAFLSEQLELIANKGVIKFLSARIKVTGRSDLSPEQITAQLEGLDVEIRIRDVVIWINKCTVDVQPEINPDELTGLKSFDGCLARLIKNLESGNLNKNTDDLIKRCAREAHIIRSNSAFGYINSGKHISDEETRKILIKQAWKLLYTLDKQKKAQVPR